MCAGDKGKEPDSHQDSSVLSPESIGKALHNWRVLIVVPVQGRPAGDQGGRLCGRAQPKGSALGQGACLGNSCSRRRSLYQGTVKARGSQSTLQNVHVLNMGLLSTANKMLLQLQQNTAAHWQCQASPGNSLGQEFKRSTLRNCCFLGDMQCGPQISLGKASSQQHTSISIIHISQAQDS